MGGENLMIVGDSIVNHHIAFEQPAWFSGSDQDQVLAAQTRVALLDQVSQAQMRFVGFHLPDGGLGRAERRDDGFIFVDPGGTHGARITTLDPEDRDAAFAIIYRWTGVEPVLPVARKTTPDRFPQWRPALP